MSLTPVQFKTLYPEFALVSEGAVSACLAAAASRLSVTLFSTFYDEALGALTAHMLTRSAQAARMATGGGGIVQSESAGDLSVTYQALPVQSGSFPNDYALTPYGMRYLSIRNIVRPSPGLL